MQIKTRAIVLSNLKYGDTGLIVHCYTEHYGRIPLMFKGVRGKRAKTKASMLMPLTLLELEISFSEKRELQFAKDVTVLNSMNNLHYDPVKNSVAIFLSEVLSKTLREQEKNDLLFQFLENSLAYFDEISGIGKSLFHLKFMLELSRFLGFYPENNYDEITTYFSPELGRFISAPKEITHINDTGLLIHKLLNERFADIEKRSVKSLTIKDALENIVTLYTSHLSDIKEFKSYNVFKAL